jgi:hypothetical protein
MLTRPLEPHCSNHLLVILSILTSLIIYKLPPGPQNGPERLGTEKLLKIVSCQKFVLS